MKGRNNKKYNLNILESFVLDKQNEAPSPACPPSPTQTSFPSEGLETQATLSVPDFF